MDGTWTLILQVFICCSLALRRFLLLGLYALTNLSLHRLSLPSNLPSGLSRPLSVSLSSSPLSSCLHDHVSTFHLQAHELMKERVRLCLICKPSLLQCFR